MKLARFGLSGAEKPAILDTEGVLRDLSGHIFDITPKSLSMGALNRIRDLDPAYLPWLEGDLRLGPCIGEVRNFYCIGVNYGSELSHRGREAPIEPIIFSKATSSIHGPSDPIILPPGSSKTDWEVELGVIIGSVCEHVSQKRALDFVAGYCVINDISERSYQLEHGGQWIKGKSAPTFGPVGPYFVTADEISDPQSLNLWLKLNGRTLQNSSTSDMIFSVAEIVSYMSKFFRLLPGDVIATGTPSGVGMDLVPPRFLKEGDFLELGIDGLGEQNLSVTTRPTEPQHGETQT